MTLKKVSNRTEIVKHALFPAKPVNPLMIRVFLLFFLFLLAPDKRCLYRNHNLNSQYLCRERERGFSQLTSIEYHGVATKFRQLIRTDGAPYNIIQTYIHHAVRSDIICIIIMVNEFWSPSLSLALSHESDDKYPQHLCVGSFVAPSDSSYSFPAPHLSLLSLSLSTLFRQQERVVVIIISNFH